MSKNLPFIPDSYLTDNTHMGNTPYRARNILSAQELPQGDIPAAPGALPEDEPVEVGYISDIPV